ncbi:MAG: tol-pal system protein YbgF [Nitrospirota bacterium]
MTVVAKRAALAAVVLSGLSGIMSGCALQADVVETRLMMDKLAASQRKLSQQMADIDAKLTQRGSVPSADGTTPVELTSQYDQLQNELRALQGQVEANHHAVGELRQQLDEQHFQLSALSAQMQTLQSAMGGAIAGTPPAARAPSAPEGGDEKLVLPGRVPAPKPGAVTPVEAYNLAYNDYLRGNYALAIGGFEQFLQQYSSSILVPHALYWLGESNFSNKQYAKAVEVFDQLIQRYPKHEKMPAAMLKNGLAHLEIGDKVQASQVLKRLVANYPTSEEANVAKGRLAEIR